jgi:hypothetical protein
MMLEAATDFSASANGWSLVGGFPGLLFGLACLYSLGLRLGLGEISMQERKR